MDDPTREDQSGFRRHAPKGAAAIAVVLVVVGIVQLAMNGDGPTRKKQPGPVAIKLLPPPPPPPPPPPEVQQEVVKVEPLERAEPKPEAPEPPGPLALDAKGEGPADGFGLGGKPGGADYTGGGDGTGGSGGNKYGSYAALMQSHVQGVLQRKKSLQNARYKLGIQMWLKPDGEAERVELIGSTGTSDLDRTLRDTLLRMARLPQTPPLDLPQPVVLQVSSS